MQSTAPSATEASRPGIPSRRRPWASLGPPALVGVGCYLGALAAHAVRLPGAPFSIIRPASAVLLTALLLSPPRRWWIFLAASIPAQLLSHPGTLSVEMVWGFLHRAALVVLAASLLRRAGHSTFRLDRLRDMAAFVALAAVGAPAVTSTTAALVFFPGGPVAYGHAWWLNFFASALGILLLVPPLTAACAAVAAGRRFPGVRKAAGAALPAAGLAVASALAIGGWGQASHLHYALLFVPLPFLLWTGVRYGPAGACVSLCVLAAAAASGAITGHGPFATGTGEERLLSLQSFILAVAVPVLFLAALHRERESTEAARRAILSAIPDMMFLQDRGGVYLDYCAPSRDALLLPPEHFLGRRMEEILPVELHEGFRRGLDEALDTGGPCIVEYQLEIRGDVHHYEARMVRCGDDSVLSIVRDITARVAAEGAVAERERALRRSRAQARALTRRLIASQEEERRRIARDIHDDFSQKLAALSLSMTLLDQREPGGRQNEAGSLAAVQERIAELAEDMRELSHRLHPAVLEYAGLAPALRSHCDEVSRLTSVACRVDVQQLPALAPEVALGVYRVAQEALRNVVRHAGAARVRVAVTRRDGHLRLVVRDDGTGFDPAAARWHPGLGIISMRERVHLLGGTLRVRSRPGAGTEVVARIPIGAARASTV